MALPIGEIDASQWDPADFAKEIAPRCRPVVMRGMLQEWPIVRSALDSPRTVAAYLKRFATGGTVEAFLGDAAIQGRYFYSDDLSNFNFSRLSMPVGEALDALTDRQQDEQTSLYLGSMPIDAYFPGLSADNIMPMVPHGRGGRLWLGHASTISAHFDTLDNLACVIAGRRRFTLYAPEHVADLYVGPIDHTMAGQPVSLAASAPRGDPRYPRFAAISDQALVAELDPGDVLYLPKLWWHQVEGLSAFNGLLNYWEDRFSSGPDAPYTTLLLAMIAIAERPAPERAAWRALFDHYVFRTNGHPLAHLPPERHGMLGPFSGGNYGRIRARLMQILRGG
jgi:hypothetical protein